MKIVILDGYTENPGDLSWEGFEALGELTVYDRTPAGKIVERIGDADAGIVNKVPLTRETFEACPSIKYVGVLATGYDVVDVACAKERGIPVCNIPTYGTTAVSQYVFALLLEICHHVWLHSEACHSGEWERNGDWCFWKRPLIELAGKTMGIIGFGRIGQMAGKIAQAFGMNVLAFGGRPDRALESETLKYAGLDELLAKSDVISLHCPLFPETRGIINKENIAKMKDGVTVVNMSRGPLIDTPALIDALNSGKVGCAGLDVFEEEPLLADNPLWHMENVYITPHVTPQVPDRTGRSIEILRENVRRYRAGEPMLNQMRQTDVYQANGAQEVTGPFGIDSKVKDIMTDDATTRTLLDILEECRGMRQQKGALYMISKYKVRQLFQLMKIPTTEEKLAEYDRRLKDSYQK